MTLSISLFRILLKIILTSRTVTLKLVKTPESCFSFWNWFSNSFLRCRSFPNLDWIVQINFYSPSISSSSSIKASKKISLKRASIASSVCCSFYFKNSLNIPFSKAAAMSAFTSTLSSTSSAFRSYFNYNYLRFFVFESSRDDLVNP